MHLVGKLVTLLFPFATKDRYLTLKERTVLSASSGNVFLKRFWALLLPFSAAYLPMAALSSSLSPLAPFVASSRSASLRPPVHSVRFRWLF